MKEVKEKIDELNSIIINLNNTNQINNDENNIYSGILDIISNLNDKVEKVLINEAALAENIKYMDQDISGIQDELFEEVSVEDLEEMEESEYKEIHCTKCGKSIFIEESALKGSKMIKCPYCGEELNM